MPGLMARVACTVMLKDEVSLTAPFLRYHAALFGADNLYVVDNGTTEPDVMKVLAAFEQEGVHVDRSFHTAEDYRRKGEIIGDLVKRLDNQAAYDFYILLDCDEFVVLRSGSTYTCDPEAIHRYLETRRGEPRILKVDTNLSNIPGRPGVFQAAEYSKTIFPRNVLGATDHGHHAGWSRSGATDFVPCDIVYVHFHYRPFDEVVRFARQKLSAEMPPEDLADTERLRNFKGRGWHLVKYVLGDEDGYYTQFRGLSNIVLFPDLLARFLAIGGEAPFSSFILPFGEQDQPISGTGRGSVGTLAARPCLVIDEATTERVRGWATDPAAPDVPVCLRFMVDGATVWEGTCDGLRPDVRRSGHPTDPVGFDFDILPDLLMDGSHILTAKHRDGTPVRLFVHGHACEEITLLPPCRQSRPSGSPGAPPPHIVIDEASVGRVRGWALDTAAPEKPVFLRFLVDGALVWDGPCTESRLDVRSSGHPTDRVGFDFKFLSNASGPQPHLLTVEDRVGTPMRMLTGGGAQNHIMLAPAVERVEPGGPIYSHIDSFRNGRVQGWALRTITTPEGPRLLGCCTVALVHQGRVVAHAVADVVRSDVAEAMQGEQRCGFVIEVPRSLASAESDPVFRLFVMPEHHELTGSPCVLAPSFEIAHE
jgi:hypothetical protein